MKEILYPEIKCLYCRISFGVTIQMNGKFHHLDPFFQPSSGLTCECDDPDYLLTQIEDMNEGKPIFKPEFVEKTNELRIKFDSCPDDISKEHYPFDAFMNAFVECMNYGAVEDEETETFDRGRMNGDDIQNMYDEGQNLYQVLRHYIIPVSQENVV